MPYRFLSVIALSSAASLAQHRVEFIQQIRRNQGLPTQNRSPADGFKATLRRKGQSHGLRVSGWGRGREALRQANIHRGSSVRDFWGLEHGVHLESGILGEPWVAIIKRNPPVFQLWANMADKD